MVLDRFDRRRIMLASDLIRAVVVLAFIVTVRHPSAWLLYTLSGLLMFVSPFFSSGRAAILPAIASNEELHTTNSLTQTTQWATLTAGTMLAGLAVARLGFAWAFALNSLSFVFSAYAVWRNRFLIAARRASELSIQGFAGRGLLILKWSMGIPGALLPRYLHPLLAFNKGKRGMQIIMLEGRGHAVDLWRWKAEPGCRFSPLCHHLRDVRCDLTRLVRP